MKKPRRGESRQGFKSVINLEKNHMSNAIATVAEHKESGELTPETMAAITYAGRPVLTTALLARLYGTDDVRIRQNFDRNEDRFVAGKHFHKLEGAELRAFKDSVSESYSVDAVQKRARSVILWTERGAARHAKMLDTDQAWDVFEKLEDCYFGKVEDSAIPARKTRKPKALPGALSVDQQQAIQALVKARAEALPKEKQGKAVVRCWSSLKSKFGCSYKEIDAEHYLDAVSLIARLPLEGELLEAEMPQAAERLAIDYPLSWWDGRKPGQPLDSLDIAAADLPLGQLPLGESSPCLRILDTLHTAGYAIDAAFYELRTYQNLMHRWQGSMRTVAFMAERIASSLSSDLAAPQHYVVNR